MLQWATAGNLTKFSLLGPSTFVQTSVISNVADAPTKELVVLPVVMVLVGMMNRQKRVYSGATWHISSASDALGLRDLLEAREDSGSYDRYIRGMRIARLFLVFRLPAVGLWTLFTSATI